MGNGCSSFWNKQEKPSQGISQVNKRKMNSKTGGLENRYCPLLLSQSHNSWSHDVLKVIKLHSNFENSYTHKSQNALIFIRFPSWLSHYYYYCYHYHYLSSIQHIPSGNSIFLSPWLIFFPTFVAFYQYRHLSLLPRPYSTLLLTL